MQFSFFLLKLRFFHDIQLFREIFFPKLIFTAKERGTKPKDVILELTMCNICVLTKTRNSLKRPGNDLQRTRNDLKRSTTSQAQPTTIWIYLKKEALTQVFSCEFCKISKNTFLQNTSGRLLLNIGQSVLLSNTVFNIWL